jgi:hypothetical protein
MYHLGGRYTGLLSGYRAERCCWSWSWSSDSTFLLTLAKHFLCVTPTTPLEGTLLLVEQGKFQKRANMLLFPAV